VTKIRHLVEVEEFAATSGTVENSKPTKSERKAKSGA